MYEDSSAYDQPAVKKTRRIKTKKKKEPTSVEYNDEGYGDGHANILATYLRDIWRHPKITKDKEQQIGAEILFERNEIITAALSAPASLKLLATLYSRAPNQLTEDSMVVASGENRNSFYKGTGSAKRLNKEIVEPFCTNIAANCLKLAKQIEAGETNEEIKKAQDTLCADMSALHLKGKYWDQIQRVLTKTYITGPFKQCADSILQSRKNIKNKEEFLLNANLRLVPHYLFKKYPSTSNYFMMDMIQEGNLALHEAIRACDWKTSSIATVSKGRIYGAVRRFMSDYGFAARRSVNMQERSRSAEKMRFRHYAKTGELLPIEEFTAITKGETQTVDEIAAACSDATSFSAPVGGDEDGKLTFGDVMLTTSPDPVDVITFKNMSQTVKGAISELSDEHQEVINRYYFKDEDFPTIGKSLGKPKQTISAREKRARVLLEQKLSKTFNLPKIEDYIPSAPHAASDTCFHL